DAHPRSLAARRPADGPQTGGHAGHPERQRRSSAGAGRVMTGLTSPLGIDPYGFASTHLSEAARGVLGTLAATLESEIRPLMAEAWETATMPAEVRATLAALRLMDPAELSEAEAASSIYAGFRNFVLARADVSVATAYNA